MRLVSIIWFSSASSAFLDHLSVVERCSDERSALCPSPSRKNAHWPQRTSQCGSFEYWWFFIELRLDSYPAIVINAVCHQVDAGICFASVIATVAPAIDLIKLAGKRRSSTEEIHHQFLKSNTVLALRLIFAELFQHVTKCSHRVIIYEITPMCSIRGGVTRHFRIL